MQLLIKVAVIVLLGLSTVIGPIYPSSVFSCSWNDECSKFHDSKNNILATCVNGRCHCVQNDIMVQCVLPNPKEKTIGGPCPCPMSDSECKDGTCYCQWQKVPSKDMRRCLNNDADLGERCEYDEQCQADEVFAVCNKTLGICTCRDGFINHDNKCLSKITDKEGFKIDCFLSTQCEKFGSAFCHKTLRHCICRPTWIGSNKLKKCLYPAKFGNDCEDDIQCQYDMGLGAICYKKHSYLKKGTCLCKEPYVEKALETPGGGEIMTRVMCDPRTTNVTAIWKSAEYRSITKIVCHLPPEIGDYCIDDEDCQHPGLTHESESLHCYMTACRCREGFVYKLNEHCVIGSAFTPHGSGHHFGYVFLVLVVIIIGIVIFIVKNPEAKRYLRRYLARIERPYFASF